MKPISSSAAEAGAVDEESNRTDWPLMPTETEIYILPDGRVVFADLPVELNDLAATLGEAESCEVTPMDQP